MTIRNRGTKNRSQKHATQLFLDTGISKTNNECLCSNETNEQ